MKYIKTPIRCPGGKSKALDFLIPHIPSYDTYVEAFIGGGSLFLRMAQLYPERNYIINDLFFPTYAFWETLYDQPMTMMNYIIQKKDEFTINKTEIIKKGIASSNAENGRKLHTWCRNEIENTIINKDEFHTACLWYILNKTSFSGMSMIGSYAKLAWDQNFSDNCIFNLPKVSGVMHSVKSLKITNLDYSELLNPDGNNVFIFLDPPYKIIHNLYGKEGNMHRDFDHVKFANDIKKCNHRWMITYNNDNEIKQWFNNYFQHEWSMTYTMKSSTRDDVDKAKIKVKTNENESIDSARENIRKNNETEKCGREGHELLIKNWN